jgi:hypothetical protein
MNDSAFNALILIALLLVFSIWAASSFSSSKSECEGKQCPVGMTAKYMKMTEYTYECLCVAVPR